MKKNIVLQYVFIYELLIERKIQLTAAEKEHIEASKAISQDNNSFEKIKAIMDTEKLIKDIEYFVNREGLYLRSLEKEVISWLRKYNEPKSIYIPAQYTGKNDVTLFINYEGWEITIGT